MGSTFRALGAALGRLHTLSTAPATELPIGQGWFYPEQALREALHYLRTAQEQGPATWRSLLAAFSAVLETVQQRPLPRSLIHGDPYLKRVAQADDGSLTLRDWHSGGLGVAVLDLGRLLYGCHLSPAEPWPWSIVPQPERIAAVLEGYQAHRRLRAVERVSLLEAIQFGIAYGASEHIARGLTSGWSAALDKKLTVRRQWFEASVEIARIAQPAIRSEG
jgi:Ser/Thr protein kinase RdoA (MazF antagonist)